MGLPAIRSITLGQPLQWLVRGARDMWRGGWLSLLHGLLPAVFGGLLVLPFSAFHEKSWQGKLLLPQTITEQLTCHELACF